MLTLPAVLGTTKSNLGVCTVDFTNFKNILMEPTKLECDKQVSELLENLEDGVTQSDEEISKIINEGMKEVNNILNNQTSGEDLSGDRVKRDILKYIYAVFIILPDQVCFLCILSHFAELHISSSHHFSSNG